MNYEHALKLSATLHDAGYSHTVVIGIHESMSPAVSCRIDVPYPSQEEGGFSTDWSWTTLAALQDISEAGGAELHISRLDKNLYLA